MNFLVCVCGAVCKWSVGRLELIASSKRVSDAVNQIISLNYTVLLLSSVQIFRRL